MISTHNLSLFSFVIVIKNYVTYEIADIISTKWKYISSQRGAPLLIHSDYLYRCERKINKRLYWLCTNYKKTKCNARIILDGNVLCKATDHNHVADKRAKDVSKIRYKDLEDDDVDEWLKFSNLV